MDRGSTDIDGCLDLGNSFVLHYFIAMCSVGLSSCAPFFVPFDIRVMITSREFSPFAFCSL